MPRVDELDDELHRLDDVLADDYAGEGPRQLLLVLDLRPVGEDRPDGRVVPD